MDEVFNEGANYNAIIYQLKTVCKPCKILI